MQGQLGWVKWKREYGDSWEVDCVVVGASYGSNGKAGGLAKFLCALLKERVVYDAASDPLFLTFVRVHSGLNVRPSLPAHVVHACGVCVVRVRIPSPCMPR